MEPPRDPLWRPRCRRHHLPPPPSAAVPANAGRIRRCALVCSTGSPSTNLRSGPKRDAASNPSRGFSSVAVAVPAPPRLLLNQAVGQATGAVAAQLGGGEGVGRVAGRLAWGSLWAVYVCVVLCALLIMALLGGGLLVGKMVEEPVQVTETLNFDYTKPSPVAFVPMQRLVPPHQRMQLELSLTLPESDYNRRLGVFQGLQSICRPQSSLREKLAGICTSMDLSCSDGNLLDALALVIKAYWFRFR